MSRYSDEDAPADGTAHRDGGPERHGRRGGARTLSRRRLLAAAAVGVGGIAGCTSSSPDSPTDPPGGDGSDDDGSDGTGDGTGDLDGGAVGRPLEGWAGYDPDWEAPTTSPLAADLETEVLVENLEIPWDLAFAPDGTLFLTERVGRVLKFDGERVQEVARPQDAIDAGSIDPGPAKRQWWVKGGEGGTLGVAVHPEYPDPSLVYVYYTASTGDGKENRVEAFDVTAEDPSVPAFTVVEGMPANNIHNGGRITFGPRNYLWITTGDGGESKRAGDPGTLNGKILRVTAEGDPAPDNPDLGSGADPRVFTYGHRNPQGIVWLPDGTPVNTEHGPRGRDEINRLVPGDHYGWNAVFEPTDYPGTDYHPPLYNSKGKSYAPTGALFYTGDAVPALRNRLVVGGLISEELLVVTLTPDGEALPPADDADTQITADWSDDAYTATLHTAFEGDLGRIRHAEQSPDGDLYLCTSNRDGRSSTDFPRKVDDVLVRVTQS